MREILIEGLVGMSSRSDRHGILYKLKPLIIACFCIVFSLWWFGLNNQSLDEKIYTRDAHNQDISKIYYDLGRSSEGRDDLVSAIKLYSMALHHTPERQEIYNCLANCYQKQGDVEAMNRVHAQRDAYKAVVLR